MNSQSQQRAGIFSRWIWLFVSYAIAAACLFWALHDIDFRELRRSIAAIHYGWTASAIFLQLLTYVCVAWEWQLLLPVGFVPMSRLTQAVFAGRFANDILPVQLGYILRVYLAAQSLGGRVAAVVPSLLMERLWDGLWLATGICVMTFFVPLSPELLRARNILGLIVFTGIALVTCVILKRRKKISGKSKTTARWKWSAKMAEFIERMSEGVHQIGRSHLLPAVLGLALVKLFIQAMSFYAMMWAYGFRFAPWTGIAVFLIAYLGICVPSTPASAGVFQICSIIGLQTFGVDKTEAAGFSLVAFIILTVPLSLTGFFAFAQSGMTFRKLRSETRQWKQQENG